MNEGEKGWLPVMSAKIYSKLIYEFKEKRLCPYFTKIWKKKYWTHVFRSSTDGAQLTKFAYCNLGMDW